MKLPLALFQFLSIFSLLCSNSASAQCLDNQKSSLLTLFGSAPTPFWTPSTDCCLWKGITCDRSGHVTGLDLTSHSLSTPINSTSLTFLSSLSKFNMPHNSLTGNIPSSLFRLPTLQYLNLSNNLFDAPLDEFNLPSSSLKSLDLSNNRLQGPIPTSLFQLKRLRTLSLSSNNFNGTVDLFMLQNIENLSSLDLSNNRLSINTSGINTSFPQIGNLKLSSCNLREFPDFLRNQLRLSTLDLSYNKIHGEIPNWVWRIGNGSLKHLDLSHNMVDSLQPPGVDLPTSKLNVLDLHANKLQGSMPIPPPSIVILDYSGNLSSEWFLNLKAMMDDEVKHQSPSPEYYQDNVLVTFGGIEMDVSRSLTTLVFIYLSSNRFHGSIPEEIGNLKSLNSLNMSCNELTGSIPSSLGNLGWLESLDLSMNQLSGAIPKQLTVLSFLSYLNLSCNYFIGRIPQDHQFIIFGDGSFQGNPGLCGPPLSTQCEVPPEFKRANLPSQNDSRWKYISIELGFVVGFWTVMGPLLFWKRGRRWYYKHVDNIFSVLLLWWDTYVMAIIKPKQGASGRVHGSASDPTEMMDEDFTIWTWMEEKSLE